MRVVVSYFPMLAGIVPSVIGDAPLLPSAPPAPLPQEVCGLKWSSDWGMLASGGNDNRVNVWSSAMRPSALKLDADQGGRQGEEGHAMDRLARSDRVIGRTRAPSTEPRDGY